MDEIEYKLNTNNSVLVVNAVDKLISTIKSQYKLSERQKFVLENEELKFLREKCTSKNTMASLTACQGLLALVELGVLDIGHTMSTVVTLLPSAHNYSAIISTMAGLLTLDLRSRLIPGQPYTCQFSLRSPQHPFITVLERNKGAEDDVIAQMHALCTHPDYTISSNSLELLRPVFLWLACECERVTAPLRPWQLLLSLPQSSAQCQLLLACVSCQQYCNPRLVERAFAAYSAVADAAIYQRHREYVMALLPVLARVSNELTRHGRDPRACLSLLERCFSLDAPELRAVAGLVMMLLAENLSCCSPLYLHELFNLGLNIISKYEYSSISLNVFTSLSLQWLHLPSYLTSSALKTASKILEIYQQDNREDSRLHMPNLIANKTFQSLLYTDGHLSVILRANQTWERIRDDPDKLKSWLDNIESTNESVKLELLPFLFGVILEKRKDVWFEDVIVKVIKIVSDLVSVKKEVSVQLLPVLLYKIANDKSPVVKLECLKVFPLMAKTKENVPTIVSVLSKLKANKAVPTSFLIMLYTSLAETQVRCFPYLQEVLSDPGPLRPDDLRWEVDMALAVAVERICALRASTHGLELVSVISSRLNKCTDAGGQSATCMALRALVHLWRGAAVAPASTWRALEPKLGRDTRPHVQVGICQLLGEVPTLRVSSAEYDRLVCDAARHLWSLVASSHHPDVVEAACDALAAYRIEDYRLKDVPEIYRRVVKLPASYCKTPADAARNPEDVLDYIPCEIWPEVFKYTNQSALSGVKRLVYKLIEREIRGYRSGVYQPSARTEPTNLSYLPPHSVVRGIGDCLKKQATAPSFEYPAPLLLSLLDVLSWEYPKPLPPLDLCFLLPCCHQGEAWRRGCLSLAARQAHTSGSAKRLVENYLQGIESEIDIDLFFDLLPILCRTMPPNALRTPIEKCLIDSFAIISNIKTKEQRNTKMLKDSVEPAGEEYTFVKQLKKIRECLECEKIHDANRTLLSQIVQNYFSIIDDDNVSWPTYVEACVPLSTTYLERMSSPSAWWEVNDKLLRKACSLRCAVATHAHCDSPLVWLNELIDAHAGHRTDREYSLRCMMPALRAADPERDSTREWFLQLMARAQVAFKETEDVSAKLYLCDVLMASAAVFSGHWTLEPELGGLLDDTTRQDLMPAAVAALAGKPAWSECVLQMLEWLCHTRDQLATLACDHRRAGAAARCCQRALLAMRHTEPFVTHKIWKRLESHFGQIMADSDD